MLRGQPHEEELRAAPFGPNKAGAAETLTGLPAPTFGFCAPVLELADRRGLQPRAHSRRPGSIPGWGTPLNPTVNLRDSMTQW